MTHTKSDKLLKTHELYSFYNSFPRSILPLEENLAWDIEYLGYRILYSAVYLCYNETGMSCEFNVAYHSNKI